MPKITKNDPKTGLLNGSSEDPNHLTAFNEAVNLSELLQDLITQGLSFLKDRKKFNREQTAVWKSLFETASKKIMPDAKAKETEGNSNLDIVIGMPNKPRKKLVLKKPEEGK